MRPAGAGAGRQRPASMAAESVRTIHGEFSSALEVARPVHGAAVLGEMPQHLVDNSAHAPWSAPAWRKTPVNAYDETPADDEAERILIGKRLQEQRSRLGMSQTVFGDEIGSVRHTISKWESGESTPPAAMLARMAVLGVDVLYVVTGTKLDGAESTLDKEESELVAHWRWSPQERRRVIMDVAKLASGR